MKINFFLIFCFFNILNAQSTNTKFEHITVNQGLSQKTVNCIIQDKRGFMWFGTQDGLNKYDGYKFTNYTNNPDNPKSISANYIWSLFEDSKGELWIGTDGGGLNIYNRETDDFSNFRYTPDDPKSISNNSINKIYEDKTGTLWIGTFCGLNRYNRKNQTFINYLKETDNFNKLNYNNIRSIFEDQSGTLWIGTQNGLYIFDKSKNKLISFDNLSNNSYNTKNLNIRSLYEDKSGFLWIGADGVEKGGGGLYKLNIKTKKITPCKSLSNIKNIWTIHKARNNIIWIGTRIQGLINIKNQKITNYKVEPNNPYSINSNNIRTIYEDRSGIIWIGTVKGGINKIDRQKNKFNFKIIFPNNTYRKQTTITSGIYEEKSNIIWIGTENEGIFGFNKYIEKFIHYKNIPNQINSLSGNSITSICKDRDGWIWVGTKHNGVNRFNKEKNIFIQYKNESNNKNSLSYNIINCIYLDHSGVIWIGTQHGGLNKFIRKTESFVRYKHNPDNINTLSDNSIKSIFEDKHGVLWIGTRNGGLNKFDRGEKKFTAFKNISKYQHSLSNNFVNVIYEDMSGSLWIGTHSGLNKFLKKKNRFLRYSEKEGLPNNVIHKILEDKTGCLWISTNKGLSKFDPEKEIFKNYNINDGLLINDYNKNAIFKSGKGEMFFGGINGINSFFPEDIKSNSYPPPIIFTAFKKFYKKIKLKKSISEIKKLELNYTDSIISFEFAALNYSNSAKNQYSYLLEGFNKEWVKLDTKHDITFTNLDPGNYTLKIKASNNDNIWNKKSLELKIIIKPPFWETWWFTFLSTIFFVTASYIIINVFKKYISLIRFWKKKHYIGNYKIIDKIASGGMGIIYRSVNLQNKSKNVAIKVIREEYIENINQRKRFINEAIIIDKLKHNNIVKVIERGEHNRQLFIVMEFLDGETLTKRMIQEKKLSINTFLRISIQLISTVISIHKHGIIHRDLKPDNIMLIKDKNQSDIVKILDFGLAKIKNLTQLTESGIIMGTINYISPEQISGVFLKASDIYSLGIIFYEMTAGEKPFMAETSIDIINQILKNTPIEPVSFNNEIPSKLNKLIMSMLEKKPESRPTTEKILEILNQVNMK